MLSRRDWIRVSLTGAAGFFATRTNLRGVPAPKINVFKTPTCTCCKLWSASLQKSGFVVASQDVSSLAEMNGLLGIPLSLQSCHVAVCNGYAISGHVPADLVLRVIKEKPDRVAGLAVPGMPRGSPGMEGGMREAYTVISFEKTGATHVYAKR